MADKRSVIKQNQIDILDMVYKYRFVSRQLLADSLGIKAGSSLHERLEVLVKHNVLAKREAKSLKLLGVPTAYYLTPKGLRTLRAWDNHDHITDKVIKASYINKNVKQSFVGHTLAVYKYTNILHHAYPSLKVFTQRDLAPYSYFPSQRPDAVFSLPTDEEDPRRYFFDIIAASTPYRAIDGKLLNYCTFFEEGGWDETDSPEPAILLVASNGRAERRLQQIARKRLQLSDTEHLRIFTTTVQAISHMDSEALIWTRVDDTDEPLELTTLLD